LIDLQPAGFRYPEAVPEHEQQQATVAGFIPASPGRFDQPFNLAPGEVLPVAVTIALPGYFFPTARPLLPPGFPAFAPVHHFVCRVSVRVRQQFAAR
jgi:hypothetical protein